MPEIHTEAHPKAGASALVTGGEYDGLNFIVEDWYDRISGFSWQEGIRKRNPDCVMYAVHLRRAPDTPKDDQVLIGSIGGHRMLMHESQLTFP